MSTLNSIKDQFRAILRRVESAFGARAAGFASLKLRVSALYVGGLLICLVLQGFASIEPLSLGVIGGDNVFTLNYAKNYINGNGFRINPNLGFPGVQDNLFFPSFDFAYRLFLKGVGAFATEAATSYYLMYLAGACAMFAATASSLRSLGFGHLISVFGSLIYVVSPYFVFRSLNHDFLALYFSAPLGATLALQIGTLPTTQTTRSFFFKGPVALSLLIIAVSGLYYAFYSILFALFAGTVASLSERRYQPALLALICALIVFPVLVITGFGAGLIEIVTNRGALVRRFAFEQLNYGLTLAEAIHVFANLGSLNRLYLDYVSLRPHLSFVTGLEEWPGIALTMTILASPLIVAVIGSLKQRSRRHELTFLSSALMVFGIIYSVNGGLGYFFNLLVSPTIRATARVMPFLSFFALVPMLALMERLLERKSWRDYVAASCLAIVLVSCMLPTVGKFAVKQRAIIANPAFQSDLQSVRNILAQKDRDGMLAVLQLPHVQWPEAGPIRSFEPYAGLKYFILDTKGSRTRWSYGGSINQPSFIGVLALIENYRETGLSVAATRLDFDGILIEKLAYDHSELLTLARNIEAGGACKSFEDELRILYAIKPLSCEYVNVGSPR